MFPLETATFLPTIRVRDERWQRSDTDKRDISNIQRLLFLQTETQHVQYNITTYYGTPVSSYILSMLQIYLLDYSHLNLNFFWEYLNTDNISKCAEFIMARDVHYRNETGGTKAFPLIREANISRNVRSVILQYLCNEVSHSESIAYGKSLGLTLI